MSLAACSSPAGPEADLGPIDDLLDDITKTVWPGIVGPGGERYVRRLNGFFDGAPTAYWFGGFAPKFTADVFVFCREDDAACPVADSGRIAGIVGRPVFSRMPGEAGYSPYWRVMVVRVGPDYEPDDIKSVFGIERAVDEGAVTVEPATFDHGGDVGSDEVVAHCLLVLEGTDLEGNGADLVGSPGSPSQLVPVGQGWHKQYRVAFYDFSLTEGVFAPDRNDAGDALMPSARIYVMFRDCAGGSTAPVCSLTGDDLGAVTERGVEADLTGDGDKSDTNNIIAAVPGTAPADAQDRPYSALWAVQVVRVVPEHDADVALIDVTGDQSSSAVTDVAVLRELVVDGMLAEPEPMSEEQAGDRIPGNEGEVFFNCPSQVAAQ